MSWKRFMAFFSVMPMYCCCSGTGRYELSKKKRPRSGSTLRNVATSCKGQEATNNHDKMSRAAQHMRRMLVRVLQMRQAMQRALQCL
jgi:hypothetical protein